MTNDQSTPAIQFGRLVIERRPLADQYDFFARGDLMFCEASPEYLQALAKRLRDEYAKAMRNGGVFSDGSVYIKP